MVTIFQLLLFSFFENHSIITKCQAYIYYFTVLPPSPPVVNRRQSPQVLQSLTTKHSHIFLIHLVTNIYCYHWYLGSRLLHNF